MAQQKRGLVVMILLICIIFILKSREANASLSFEEYLELETQLKLLNKPWVSSFQTAEGEIIDCVDINKQPALDHPLLKNHKVQRKPTTYPNASTKFSSKSKAFLNLKSRRKSCPDGTVPIRRTLKEDLIRVRTISNQRPNISFGQQSVVFPSNQHVVSLSMKQNRPYFGAFGDNSVYNLSVAQDQSTSSNIWVVSGPPQELNVLLVGWQVSPAVNGDSLTRLFVYWTVDGSTKTGCYNMLCQGFIQTNPKFTPSAPVTPTTSYGGAQYAVSFLVHQDTSNGNWWFAVEKDTYIGYWPKELFTHLYNGADQVGWGGIARAGLNGVSPPMGSGHMPNIGYKTGTFFSNLNYIDAQLQGHIPKKFDLEENIDESRCYGLVNSGNCRHHHFTYCFTYGGPGGECGN